MNSIIKNIRDDLKHNSEEKIRESGKRFFREKVKPYGVKTAVVKRIVQKYYKEIKDSGKENIFTLCEELWMSGYMEESFIACKWSYYIHMDYTPADFTIFEKWVNTFVSNWASCDTLCNHTMGAFIDMYPEYLDSLKTWARSNNRWVRRAAAVSLIIPAKEGRYLKDIFEIADILLTDNDDLVQKGYGWMLKAASQAHCDEVLAYVMRNKKNMPRTALRYAIEKMPPEMKKKAMDRP